MKPLKLIICLIFLSAANWLNAQWLQQPFPSTEDLYKVRFVNSNAGWVLGENAIYKTVDGGKTWAKQDASTKFGNLLLALNENVVFYSGAFSMPSQATTGLRRTTDGGLTWQTVDSSYFYYFDMALVNDRIGYVSASNTDFIPAILKTTTGGKTWKTIAKGFSPARYELTGISFVDAQRGWAVSYDAMIFQTRDGGMTWALQDSIRPVSYFVFPLRNIKFTTADSGWAVGGLAGTSLLVKTIDGGRHWNVVAQSGCSFRDLNFLNSQTGWIAGTASPLSIFFTNDGGNRWTPQSLEPLQLQRPGIRSISMVNENYGWAVSDLGRVYKLNTTVAVNTPSPNSTPSRFRLEQNRPNPFNSSTRIDYAVTATMPIRLAVYDVLGREVALLFDGVKSPGNYSADWTGRGHREALLPSGIYFYRLHAGANLVLTRKLILIR